MRARIVEGSAAALLGRHRPDVLVIDDPSPAAAIPWTRTARAAGVPTASIHDLGLAACAADLEIDGSIAGGRRRGGLTGPDYSILDAAVLRERGAARDRRRVLIALGGGARAGVARAIGSALLRARPGLHVRIASGFVGGNGGERAGLVMLGPVHGLARELARCGVAVTAGGVSLYEAVALGTPVVAWPVVRAQHPTVAAFARRGLAVAVKPGPRRVARAVSAVLDALDRPAPKRRPPIDGRGASRAAAAIVSLAEKTARRGRG
jgi:hypothetical protein